MFDHTDRERRGLPIDVLAVNRSHPRMMNSCDPGMATSYAGRAEG